MRQPKGKPQGLTTALMVWVMVSRNCTCGRQGRIALALLQACSRGETATNAPEGPTLLSGSFVRS